MLAELNSINSITAVTDKKLIYNENLIEKINNDLIFSFPENQNPNIEKIVESGSKIIVHSAFGGDFPNEEKLKKFDIYAIPNFDWMEAHPLGKAEWILLFGYLVGKEKLAKIRFNHIEKEYLKQIEKNVLSDKVVLMGNLMGDYWIAPAPNSFNAQFIKDAGGIYLFESHQSVGSLNLNFENVVDESKNTSIWINPGFDTKKKILDSNPKANLINAFNERYVFCYSRNLNKYWELAPIQPHLVLSDYINIIQNDNLENLYFYQKVE
jgi:iron complex transport system substrate-binding protein